MRFPLWAEQLEILVDEVIPYCLIVLAIILVIEFFFVSIATAYTVEIEVVDILILVIFITDLVFKYFESKTFGFFFKHYWLEIIAVLPLYWFFRAFEGAIVYFQTLREGTVEAQKLVHVGAGIQEAQLISSASEEERILAEVTRAERFERFIKPIARTPRALEATEFFEHPKQRKIKTVKTKKIQKKKKR